MPTTLKREYRKLLERFPLRPIKDDAHLEAAMEVVRELVARKDTLTPDEHDYHAVLLQLIKSYEDNDPAVRAFMAEVDKVTPSEALEFLMEQNGLTQTQLAERAGVDQSVLSLCLSGKRAFSKGAALRLAEHFKVSPALFLKSRPY